MTVPPSEQVLDAFAAIVGRQNTLANTDDLSRYTDENRGIFIGATPLVLKPDSTEEVAEIVRLANREKIALVPQGGHTGHAAGGAPDASGHQVVVSLERMNRVRDIDAQGNTAVVEAGMVLQAVQQLAEEHDRLFPLSLASEGSCQIGGNISTNAGGTAVLAYGNTRNLVLGVEVVTAKGEIWDGLRRLRKDNTGYDLRDLFIGSEGTLGIITAAVVKLFPKPRGRVAAIAGLASPADALKLLNEALAAAGPSLTGFELLPRVGMDAVFDQFEKVRDPLQSPHPWYVLMEVCSGKSDQEASAMLEDILGHALETDIVDDAVLSHNETQRQAMWIIREVMPASQKGLGGSVKNDISVPVHHIPEFLERADKAIHGYLPDAIIFAFGHMGDGNIHYNISQPPGDKPEAFLARRQEINALVNQVVTDLNGSISAEHGIGQLKRNLLAETKSAVEMDMMRAVKQALDPNGIMNPGKVL